MRLQLIYMRLPTCTTAIASTIQSHPARFTEPEELSAELGVGALAAVERELVGPPCTESVEMVDENGVIRDVDDSGLIGVTEVEVVEGCGIDMNVTDVIRDDKDEFLADDSEVDVADPVTFPVQTDPFAQHPPWPSGVATQYWPLEQHPPPAIQYIRKVIRKGGRTR